MMVDAPGVRCRCSVHSVYPLDEDALGRIAGMHVWSRRLPQPAHGGGRAPARADRARLGRAASRARRRASALELPTDDDLLPALTDSAFDLLVERLEQALRGPAAVRA